MTREELKAHCLKQIEGCEMWARYKGEEPHGKIYEEHKLILELLEREPRWISVSEKLPFSDEECHTFLVTDSNGKVTLSEFYLSLSDRKPYWSGMIDVIAWMSLPQPYKVESEDKE